MSVVFEVFVNFLLFLILFVDQVLFDLLLHFFLFLINVLKIEEKGQ
jgi:hypothetical protein